MLTVFSNLRPFTDLDKSLYKRLVGTPDLKAYKLVLFQVGWEVLMRF